MKSKYTVIPTNQFKMPVTEEVIRRLKLDISPEGYTNVL